MTEADISAFFRACEKSVLRQPEEVHAIQLVAPVDNSEELRGGARLIWVPAGADYDEWRAARLAKRDARKR